MGACGVKKSDLRDPIKNDSTVNHNQIIQTQYPMPKPKVHLQFSHVTEYYGSIPIIEITESMAYNFLVRQGVNMQNQSKKETDYQGVYLFTEKSKINFFDFGFISIDMTRLEKVIENKQQYKFLFDFKIIWVFKDYQEKLELLLNILKEINVKVKQIHIFNKPIEKFMEQFKMFTEISIVNSCYPLLQFEQKDTLEETKRSDETFRIYLHNNSSLELLFNKNQITLYHSNLGIRNIIFLYQNVKFPEIKKLEENLYKINCYQLSNQPQGNINSDILVKELIPYLYKLQQTSSNVLLIYSTNENQAIKIARLAIEQYMLRQLLIFPEEVQQYHEQMRSLYIKPQAIQTQIIQPQQQQIQEHVSRETELGLLYQSWFKQQKSIQFLQGSHNLILKLLNNIIDNPTEDKYRTLQLTNKTVNLNIMQYNEGKQIMSIVGFVQKETELKNIFDISELKFTRSDLEIAWKNYVLNIK